ncbi:TonB-dependent receptor [Sediminibacterium roseum]|uniref:TonB-dependent receptor n=1 Tax=Sediminibacterium roseum TaxID=1978412 RepID=A0ABW9ZYR2_9BACT|nr:outer membrane beta-barrel protein [Sediminibacterium roseum]NCI50862.1 TonB-dependent receptor [Sediminibacterium roseum]
MKKVFTLTFVLFSVLAAMAQSGSISGRLKDSATGKGLAYATVTVFKAKDTAIITYRLSNPEGEFKVGGLPFDLPLRAIITFSGYQAFRKEFTLTAAQPNLVLDSVKLGTTSHQLDEVIVVSERPPVSIKNDTIEFNATAFKTLPNALVEDLLKKLPGVQVDADGNITVNGKPVNRILVDGKTFFGSDPKMATRNLPANIIDKVQVVDDKEQLLANGDDNLNNVGKVVNITLKKGVKKGWFGKLYAGGGSDNRFEGGGIANIFRDTLQVSVLGYANNLNKPGFGFSDLMQAGGLDRSNSNLNSRSTSIWTNGAGSGISINGVSFGGMQNYGGIATSRGAGFNLNHAPNAKQSLFAQYFYGNVLIDRRNENDTKQYNADTVIHNNSILTGDVITHAHNIGIGGKFKPDSVTTINLSANYTIGLQDEDRFSDIYSDNNKLGALSNGRILQKNLSNTYYYRHAFSMTHLSKTKKGRRLNLFHNYEVNNRFNDYSTNSNVHYLYPSTYDSAFRQLRQEALPRTDVTFNFNYSEPVSKVFTLRVGGIYSYNKIITDITTFNPNTVNQKLDVLNPFLTSNFSRENNRLYLTTGFEFRWKDLTINPQARYLGQSVNNVLASLPAPIKQSTSDLLPGLNITYKQFQFNYNKDIAIPNYTYLIPVADNTNPYFISKGNPNLVPTERHNFSVNYYFNDPKKNMNIGLNANGGFSYNDFVNTITVDAKGVQTSYPINANGSVNYGINYNINRQYKHNPKFIYNWNLGAWYGYNRGQLVFNGETSYQQSYNLQQWAGLGFNFNDKLEWNNNGSVGVNFTDYTSKQFKKLQVWNYNLSSEVIVRMPKHVIWESSVNYSNNGNTVPGVPKTYLRWNAAINFTMLKDEKGVLRISVFDILNRGNQINASANRNMISTYQTNVLSRYLMATFTYNIRTIGGAKKKVGGERLFLF